MHKNSSISRYYIVFVSIIGFVIFILSFNSVAAKSLTDDNPLYRAWQKASDFSSYQFRTSVLQITQPTADLANVGRRTKTTGMTLEGHIDTIQDELSLLIDPQQAGYPSMEMKVEAGVAYIRNEAGVWERSEDDISNAFAPQEDPLGILGAAENVQLLLPDEEGKFADSKLLLAAYQKTDITRYAFDVNGEQYAEMMRQDFKAHLTRQEGISTKLLDIPLDPNHVYMKAHGEMWLDAQGLPIRLMVHFAYPVERGDLDKITADITTEFTKWDTASLLTTMQKEPARIIHNPATLLAYAPSAKQVQETGINLLLIFLIVGFGVVLLTCQRSRYAYTIIIITIILGMLLQPMAQIIPYQQIAAFQERQQEKQKAQTEAKEHPAERFDPQASFDPFTPPEIRDDLLTDPMYELTKEGRALLNKPATIMAPLQVNTSCQDDDPLNNEAITGTDCDGDGLTDDIEQLKLGTHFDHIDSDEDGISDRVEVAGIEISGTRWYLDPKMDDTNGDSINDSTECPELADIYFVDNMATISDTFTYGICTDTDNDQVPDVFDFDNDGDGVMDKLDSFPQSGMLVEDSFTFKVSDYDEKRSIQVDFQIRPTDPKHLYQTDNVLEWANNDRDGQIGRVFDNTLADIGIPVAGAEDGDVLLTPVIQLRFPYSSTNPTGGIPKLITYTSDITVSTPISLWADFKTLDYYGLDASMEEDGTRNLYVPLATDKDKYGNPVSWSGKAVYYLPEDGKTLSYETRLVWFIRGIADSCDPFYRYNPTTEEDDYIDCDNDDAWTMGTGLTLLHAYYEPFYLIGMSTSQDYALEAALITQNDAEDSDRERPHDDMLFHLTSNLRTTYLEGQLDENGERFDVAAIVNRFDEHTSHHTPDHEDYWGFEEGTFNATIYTTDGTDENHIEAGITINSVTAFSHLTETYATGVPTETVVTMLHIQDSVKATVGFDDSGTVTQAQDVINFSLATTTTFTSTTSSLTWFFYGYDGESWHDTPLDEAMSQLGDDLGDYITDSDLDILTVDETAIIDYALARTFVVRAVMSFYVANATSLAYATEVLGESLSSEVLDDSLYGLHEDDIDPIFIYALSMVAMVLAVAHTNYEIEIDGVVVLRSVYDLPTFAVIVNGIGYFLTEEVPSHGYAKFAVVLGVAYLWVGYFFLRDWRVFSWMFKGSAKLMKGVTYTFHFGPDFVSSKLFLYTFLVLIALAIIVMVVAQILVSKGKGSAELHIGLNISLAGLFVIMDLIDVMWYSSKFYDLVKKITLLVKFSNVLKNLAGWQVSGPASSFSAFKASLSLYKSASRIMAVQRGALIAIFIVVIIVSFFMAVLISGIKWGGPAFNLGLAAMLAEVLYYLIWLAIQIAFPFVGTVLYMITDMIDSILRIVCEVDKLDGKRKHKDDFVCAGIKGAFVTHVAYFFYNVDIVLNLDDEDRLDVRVNSDILTDPEKGFIVGNTFHLSYLITNTVRTNRDLSKTPPNSEAKRSSFEYSLAGYKVEDTPSLGDTSWIVGSETLTYTWYGNPPQYPPQIVSYTASVFTTTATVDYDLVMRDHGVNVPMKVYFNEGLIVPVQECVFLKICEYPAEDAITNVSHNYLGNDYVFDVFPETFSQFVSLKEVSPNRYRLAWDDKFPVLRDADGDGLLSGEGGDPNDGNPDTDGDGLSDFVEFEQGTDAEWADIDCDGLTDYWELTYGTDPYDSDTDGDGLLDGIELFHQVENVGCKENPEALWEGGWEYIYDYDTDGQPYKTWVNADPLFADVDGDGINDSKEKVYGYNPFVLSSLNVLTITNVILESENGILGGYVARGDDLTYTVEVANDLNTNREAYGLFEAELPVDVVQDDQSFYLLGQDAITLTGSVNAVADVFTRSQVVSMTLRAGAIIEEVTADTDPTNLLLWLRAKETSAPFYDYSGRGHATNATPQGEAMRYEDPPVARHLFYHEKTVDSTGEYFSFAGDQNKWTRVISQTGLQILEYEIQSLEIESSNDFTPDTFSMAFWFKNEDYRIDTKLITKTLAFKLDDFHVFLVGRSVYASLHNEDCNERRHWRGAPTIQSSPIDIDEWNHVALTYSDADNFTLYVNGQAHMQANVPNACIDEGTNDPIYLGAHRNSLVPHPLGSDFDGYITDYRWYDTALAPREVVQLSEYSRDRLFHLPFDEAPGVTVFQDVAGSMREIACTSSSFPCPISGRSGLNNQALTFKTRQDGFAMGVEAEELGLTSDDDFTVMAWIKLTDPDNLDGIVLYTHNVSLTLQNGYPRFGSTLGPNNDIDFQLQVDEWYFVVWQYKASNGNGKIFISSENKGARELWSGNVASAIDNAHPNSPVYLSDIDGGFIGQIDDLIIEDSLINDDEYWEFLDEGAILNFHFDEDEATRFDDVSPSRVDVSCMTITCPVSGVPGMMREAIKFSGIKEGLYLDTLNDDFNRQPLYLVTDLSVSLWIKPVAVISSSTQTILNIAGVHVLEIPANSLYAQFTYCNTAGPYTGATIRSDVPLLRNQWNHVMVTVAQNDVANSPAKLTMYINGARDVEEEIYRSTIFCMQSASDGATIGKHFIGELDELVVYPYELSPVAVARLFDYQNRWFDVKVEKNVYIDDGPPTVELESCLAYIDYAFGNRIWGYTFRDDVSYVETFTATLQADGVVVSTTVQSPPTGVYVVPPLDTNKAYTLDLAVEDPFGHKGSSSCNFTTDGDVPGATLDQAGDFLGKATPFTLTGSINDAISGVHTETVTLDLTNVSGHSYRTGIEVIVSGGRWHILPLEAPLYGAYDVAMYMEDKVGNSVHVDLGMVSFDQLSPAADIYVPSANMSGSRVISGRAYDLPYPFSKRTLHLPFEGGANSIFMNMADSADYIVACDACPTPNAAGQVGTAVAFNGIDDQLFISSTVPAFTTANLGLANSSFTVMAWVKGSSWTGVQPVVSTHTFAGQPGITLYIDGDKPAMHLDNMVLTTTKTLTASVWHHVTWRYDHVDQTLAIFVDGARQSEVANAEPYKEAATLLVGADTNGNLFNGFMDELIIYDSALEDEAIYRVANHLATTVKKVDLRFNRAGDDANGSWQRVTLDTPKAMFTTWYYWLPNDFPSGYYTIDLRVVDDSGNKHIEKQAWAGHIDITPPQVMLAVATTGQGFLDVTCTATDDYMLALEPWDCPASMAPTVAYQSETLTVGSVITTVHYPITMTAAVTSLASSDLVAPLLVCDAVGNCVSGTVHTDVDDLSLTFTPSDTNTTPVAQVEGRVNEGGWVPMPLVGTSWEYNLPNDIGLDYQLDLKVTNGYGDEIIRQRWVQAYGGPLAVDDWVTTNEDVSVMIDFTTNDRGHHVVLNSIINTPIHGAFSLNNDGHVIYTPTADFHGSDSFVYTIKDSVGGVATATVSITVLPQNDPVIAVDDSATVDEDNSVVIDVLANDSDIDGDLLTVYQIRQSPQHGTVSIINNKITYTPYSHYYGPDSFKYRVLSGGGIHVTSADAMVAVTVNPVNDPPVAEDERVTTDEDTAVTIDVLANDSDPVEGDSIFITDVTIDPRYGIVIIASDGSNVTYTPTTNFNDTATFIYTISDGNGGFDTAEVEVGIFERNDDPIAVDDLIVTAEDTPVMIEVLLNDSDPENHSLSIDSYGHPWPGFGSIVAETTTITYTPDANFNGIDSFGYKVQDGWGGYNTAIVTVTVTAENDAPVIADDMARTNLDTAVEIDVLANDSDVDDDVLQIAHVTVPMSGTAIITGGYIIYTPMAGFEGVDAFSYMAGDGIITKTGQVTITVSACIGGVVFVDDEATGNKTGANWGNAMTSLQSALTNAAVCPVTEIWVAAGVYTPGSSRSDTFALRDGLTLYGGFAGHELALVDRDWQNNVTVLSGDIDGNDANVGVEGITSSTKDIQGNNSYHVVTSLHVTSTAVLDGFTISGGQANDVWPNSAGGGLYNQGGQPILRHVNFIGNFASFGGGGMGNFAGGHPAIQGAVFAGNEAMAEGGAIFNEDSNLDISNAIIKGNLSTVVGGGAISNRFLSSLYLLNVTIVGNHTKAENGGAIYNEETDITFENTIMWNNTATDGVGGVQISNIREGFGASETFLYSLMQNSYPAGEGNLDGTNIANTPTFVEIVDPSAAPISNGDLHLTAGSPSINAGSNELLLPSGLSVDLDNQPRIQDEIVDLGAYEYQPCHVPVAVTNVIVVRSGHDVRLSWTDMGADSYESAS